MTLLIGVLVSMFSAIFVTRTFLRLMVRYGGTRNVWWYGVNRRPQPAGSASAAD